MKILVVDDHSLFCAGMKEFLQASFVETEVLVAQSYSMALEIISDSEKIDLLLIDLDLQGDIDGLTALPLLKAKYQILHAAILSASDRLSDIQESLRVGATGFIPKSAKPEIFVQAINLIMAGEMYLPSYYFSTTTQTHRQSITQPSSYQRDSEFKLTPREKEVSECLLSGKSNKAIAFDLGISEGTVKLHVSSILEKLGVKNRSQAILKLKSTTYNAA